MFFPNFMKTSFSVAVLGGMRCNFVDHELGFWRSWMSWSRIKMNKVSKLWGPPLIHPNWSRNHFGDQKPIDFGGCFGPKYIEPTRSRANFLDLIPKKVTIVPGAPPRFFSDANCYGTFLWILLVTIHKNISIRRFSFNSHNLKSKRLTTFPLQ